MPVNRFCSNCGAQLSVTARFCASCGKAVQQQTAAPSLTAASTPAPVVPASSQPQETILGVIPGANRRSGFMGMKIENFVIVITNLRVIFAAQTAQMMQANVQRARLEAKEGGKGFFGQWGAQFGANSGRQYFELAPQQILTEQPTNFFLPANQMRSIKLWESQGDEDSTSTYYMEFDTPAGKHKFDFGSLNIRALKDQLRQIYGNIVR